MAIETYDSRRDDADRQFAYWTQRGVSAETVSAMLPALVSKSSEARESAQRWLSNNGVTGHDLSERGMAEQRHVTQRAHSYVQGMKEEGVFAGLGEEMFNPGDRYTPSTEQISERLDELSPLTAADYHSQNRENFERVARSDGEALAGRRTDFGSEDTGYPTGVNRPFFMDGDE